MSSCSQPLFIDDGKPVPVAQQETQPIAITGCVQCKHADTLDSIITDNRGEMVACRSKCEGGDQTHDAHDDTYEDIFPFDWE